MEQQDLAFNRLLKKLSALRATLKSDERNLLDGLVTGSVDEVGAHTMKGTPTSPARNTISRASPDEARANAMHISTAKAAAKATSPDEAHANAMHISTAKSTAKATSPDETRANAMTVTIIYDQTKNEYTRSY